MSTRIYVYEPGPGDDLGIRPHIIAEFAFGAAEDLEESIAIVVAGGWLRHMLRTSEELQATEEGRAALEAWKRDDDRDLDAAAAFLESNRDHEFERAIDDALDGGNDSRAKRLVEGRMRGLREASRADVILRRQVEEDEAEDERFFSLSAAEQEAELRQRMRARGVPEHEIDEFMERVPPGRPRLTILNGAREDRRDGK
jgi:hypothetical protein